ncbi:ABC transporter ATP-binding protein [Paenibacillus sedimenti]|uniref:ABC transporter ATP-binding protein n=1 Tax=Paenibacillus sedimenti TaxID=2770274 RepID=A0A926KNR1_9BACL|nr:ABC transporter ATP-binding protein [Paenibacillus sedimenti]MBD0380508.1 ABC transporter ATP-binding protein [Paenibacillus sedimenti]
MSAMSSALSSPEIVLSVKNVKKRIKNKEIIKGISFDVYAGEIFGFLGPNGSGKTTTIRMLVDLIRPTEGSIQICGHDVHKEHNQALRHVGCIVENPELYSYLTGWENLEHFASMLPDVDEQRIAEVVEIVSMDGRIHDKVRTYSLGMRQRLGIAQALLGRPSLLILDEPTNGLDPQGIKEMREFIHRLAQDGLSLFVSSHLLSEIQQMCDRVAIISHGQVIKVGAVDELVAQGGKVVWSVAPADKAEELIMSSPYVSAIEDIAYDRTMGQEPSVSQIVTQMNKEHVPQVSRQLMEAGISLYSVEIKNPTLEDLFLSLTEGEKIG